MNWGLIGETIVRLKMCRYGACNNTIGIESLSLSNEGGLSFQ